MLISASSTQSFVYATVISSLLFSRTGIATNGGEVLDESKAGLRSCGMSIGIAQ